MEDTNQDTSQQPVNPLASEAAFDAEVADKFGAPVESSERDSHTVGDAFTQATEEQEQVAPQEGQPPAPQETPTQVDAKNDERRYQYWQSQAAKRENELAELKQQLSEQSSAQEPQAPAEQPREEFPPPPDMPQKPRGFSYEEAMSDSNSESARYLDEKEGWDNDMRQYNELRHQYDLAVMQEKLDKQNEYITSQEQQRQARIEQGRQINQISEHVQGHYGFTPAETEEFIKTMSDPSSISMDNLVQLFRMNKAAGQQATGSGPSEEFQQMKNAQQIPSPMGVLPSQSNQPQRSATDQIMDDIINTHKAKNPWT
jgi:hypothetical protein